MSTTIETYVAKIDVAPDGCWNWTGYRDRDGYGRVGSAQDRSRLAHRWSFEFFVGPIPQGLQLDHLCRNRGCVNPDHLEPVTPLANSRRGVRAQQTHCIHGHEFTPENTYTGGRSRQCRACNAEAARRYRGR